jgi:hypothetical protein
VNCLPHTCQACHEPITDPDDAVYLGHWPSEAGPGWEVYAHRAHVDRVGPDPVLVNAVARLLVVTALRS